MLQIQNTSLETENARLQQDLNVKIERDVAEELAQDDQMAVANTLTAQVSDLQKELDAKKKNERA